jgi:hypothetical protein
MQGRALVHQVSRPSTARATGAVRTSSRRRSERRQDDPGRQLQLEAPQGPPGNHEAGSIQQDDRASRAGPSAGDRTARGSTTGGAEPDSEWGGQRRRARGWPAAGWRPIQWLIKRLGTGPARLGRPTGQVGEVRRCQARSMGRRQPRFMPDDACPARSQCRGQRGGLAVQRACMAIRGPRIAIQWVREAVQWVRMAVQWIKRRPLLDSRPAQVEVFERRRRAGSLQVRRLAVRGAGSLQVRRQPVRGAPSRARASQFEGRRVLLPGLAVGQVQGRTCWLG